MVAKDWFDFPLTGHVLDAGGPTESVRVRFVCRNDGVIIFQIETPLFDRGSGLSGLTNLAEDISDEIKSNCGHVHIFNGPDVRSKIYTFTMHPVFTESFPILGYKDFLNYCADEEKLASLRAISRRDGKITDEPALLVQKKFYSSLFDRVCRQHEGLKRENAESRTIYDTPKSQNFLLGGLLAFSILLVMLFINLELKFVSRKAFLFSILFLAGLVISFAFVWYNKLERMLRRIKLNQALLAYLAHGNNYVRVLQRFDFRNCGGVKGLNDFSPVISVVSIMNESLIRSSNAELYRYSLYVAAGGLLVTLLAI